MSHLSSCFSHLFFPASLISSTPAVPSSIAITTGCFSSVSALLWFLFSSRVSLSGSLVSYLPSPHSHTSSPSSLVFSRSGLAGTLSDSLPLPRSSHSPGLASLPFVSLSSFPPQTRDRSILGNMAILKLQRELQSEVVYSLPLFTASIHCLYSLPLFTASIHCLYALPLCTASMHCPIRCTESLLLLFQVISAAENQVTRSQ
jgi:hypothetical protein